MDFRIADTFTGILSKPTCDEYKAVKAIAPDLQIKPVEGGFSVPRLGQATDKTFRSVRVNSSVRLFVYKASSGLLPYMACTRAGDPLLVTSGNTPSEFLDDLRLESKSA